MNATTQPQPTFRPAGEPQRKGVFATQAGGDRKRSIKIIVSPFIGPGSRSIGLYCVPNGHKLTPRRVPAAEGTRPEES